MASVLYGNGIIDARGSVGGTVMTRGRSGATHKAKTSPVQPPSSVRNVKQGIFVTASRAWSLTLSAADRAAWNAFALVNPSTNAFGAKAYLSGFQWFCKCAMNKLAMNGSFNNTPPLSGSLSGPLSFSTVANSAAGGSLVLTWTDVGGGGVDDISVWCTPVVSPGLSYVRKEFRQIEFQAGAATPLDFTAPYLARFGAGSIIQGKKIFSLLTFFDGATGIDSAGIIAETIVL